MAKSMGVWGIDIGQCALKALRCHLEGDSVVADAFDFIEYPKLLSQPDANPQELIKEALEQFLSRNDVIGDKVAISVPGQSGLARYFKPPPVDAKKIADIVKYEARQQIPFPLEDVIWDYQRMGGGTEIDGIALETEVGLFAMKREQVYKALQPFITAGIEVDMIQLAPLCIYNYVVYDLLDKTLPPPETFDPDAPPPSTVVVSIGTDTTDLVVTNGYRVWQRNIPLGGNHFTKQLTKELKFTFAKAEHIKRNAHQAEDPKQVFQAMRPVFNDMVTELQRSLSFFQNLDRKAHINNVVVLGNTIKLPGLKQYLTKHLGYNVIDFENFERLAGDGVTKSPAFRDNLLAFGPCYGLCLQGLKNSKLSTNLLPREITTERMIRAKKPWAVAAVALFLMGCAFNYISHNIGWRKAHLADWDQSLKRVTTVSQVSAKFKDEDDKKKKRLEFITKLGDEVVGNPDRRILWLELTKAVSAALPRTIDDPKRRNEVLDPKVYPFNKQKELRITSVESQYFPDLKLWYEGQGGAVKKRYADLISQPDMIAVQATPLGQVPAAGQAVPGAAPSNNATTGSAVPGQVAPGQAGPAVPMVPGAAPPTAMPPAGGASPAAANTAGAIPEGPQGPGWVIEIHAHHFYTANAIDTGPNHVRKTLLKNLMFGTVDLPGPNGKEMKFTMKEMGIGYPILATDYDLDYNYEVPNPNYDRKSLGGGPSMGLESSISGPVTAPENKALDAKALADNPPFWKVTNYRFVVQFAWQEKTLRDRLEARAKLAAEQALQNPSGVAPPIPGVPGAAPANFPPPAVGIPAESATAPAAVTPPAAAPAAVPPIVPESSPAAPPTNPMDIPTPPAAAAPVAAPAVNGGN